MIRTHDAVAVFDALYAKFGGHERVYWDMTAGGLFRFRAYDDGVWLDDAIDEPVVYWGA